MSNTIKDKIIMGIDPGTNIMGFGIIKVVNNTMEILELNELNISKEKDHYLKLSIIFKSIFLFYGLWSSIIYTLNESSLKLLSLSYATYIFLIYFYVLNYIFLTKILTN